MFIAELNNWLNFWRVWDEAIWAKVDEKEKNEEAQLNYVYW
jgi:hypothetical protein